ncbi:MAG: hypothetical protein K5889_03555, partial [Lachnospiraceae bacterium]|nr:hypothetical protein [Lachnospiraceae bacterium]
LGAQVSIRYLSDRGESIANRRIHDYLLNFIPYIIFIGYISGLYNPVLQIHPSNFLYTGSCCMIL